MEYAIIGVALVLLALIGWKIPKVIKPLLLGQLIKLIKENEAWVTQWAYNKLPLFITSKLSSKDVADVVGRILKELVVIIEEESKK